MQWEYLTTYEKSLLMGTLLGDGHISIHKKKYPNANFRYGEHFSMKQLEYREWKLKQAPRIFSNIVKNHNGTSASLTSRYDELFTWLRDQLYIAGKKSIPLHLLSECTDSVFLLALYLDDGSLCLTRSSHSKKNQIILTPHIALYLQAFHPSELNYLSQFINETFGHQFVLSRRNDGHNYILRIQKTQEALNFLEFTKSYATEIPSMTWKLDWEYRLSLEKDANPDKSVITSKPKNDYTEEEIEFIVTSKLKGRTDKEIAEALDRTYWSVVYKWQDIKNNRLLEENAVYVS
ncbi:endonuclease [Exiguobacterium sp. s157]|uniref:endonuclease n=1 Tax=Exiguobacterium sp. s157 TaxID=2751233 RepID=UPI001BE5CE71|nr:endonuclease [Exiguobacterium sp. s157]